MKCLISPGFRKWMRIIHRDLGYLMVGVCLVYGISGVLMNHLNGKDPAYRIEQKNFLLSGNLSKDEFVALWKERKDVPEINKISDSGNGQYRLMLRGGSGVYDPQTGRVDYEIAERRLLVYWINRLHYNHVKGWSVMGDIFAVSLVFFAVSGLIMVPGKRGIAGRGKWYLLAGLLIPVIYICLSL